MVDIADYAGTKPTWCPGCGNFAILTALKQALVALDIEPHRLLLVSGIGQAGKLPHYTRGNVFNSLHGRTLPPATGAKIANAGLIVIAISGDGDAYGEGGNHFLGAARRNNDITYLVHNNQVYGLTKGQASPTSDFGFVTKTTPQGADMPLNPVALAIVARATFVARGFAGDVQHLSQLIVQAIQHRGFALIDILQPCPTFNHQNTFAWFRERVYKLDGGEHDPTNRRAALEKAEEWGDRIPIGVVYREQRATFEDRLPALARGPLAERDLDPMEAEKLLVEFL
jgi:2-oxoglutarate ferredoxin oxidoreductase subunit beta